MRPEKAGLTADEQYQEDLKRLEKLRPIDDDFMRELFRNNIPLTELVLRIITGIDDLHIISEHTQYDLKHLLGARSLCLDVLADDSTGKLFNVEVQRSDKGAAPKRARYHSSAADVEVLRENQDFEQLPDTYVIFITENDTLGSGKPVSKFEMRDKDGNLLNDGRHIIFVNCAYNNEDDNSDIAKLIHDFKCSRAEDMHLELMAERTRYYKEIPEGVSHMCKIMEDMVNDARREARREARRDVTMEFALNLIERGKDTIEEISEVTGLSVREVEELKAECEQ